MEYKDLVFNGTYIPKTSKNQAELRVNISVGANNMIIDIERFIKYHRDTSVDMDIVYVDDIPTLVLYGNPLSDHDFNNLLDMECTCKDFHWEEMQCPYALEFADNPDEVEYCMCCEFCAGNCAYDI